MTRPTLDIQFFSPVTLPVPVQERANPKHRPTLTFWPETGAIRFSKALCEKLKICAGESTLVFGQERTRPREWFMAFAANGFQVSGRKVAVLRHRNLVSKILESLNCTGPAVFEVAVTSQNVSGHQVYTIQTAQNLYKPINRKPGAAAS